MGRFLDFLQIEAEMPEPTARCQHFVTRDLGETMQHHTLTADGRLVRHRVQFVQMTEEELDAAGIADPLERLANTLREVPDGEEELPFEGYLVFWDGSLPDPPEFVAHFRAGRLVGIHRRTF